MDEDRTHKIEAGRRKLAAYKRKKEHENKNNSDSASTSTSADSSLHSLSPENAGQAEKSEAEGHSDSSQISEHIVSSTGSVENDRSLQEIEISNLLENLHSDNDERISQEAKPLSLSDEISVVSLGKVPSPNFEVTSNVQSILEEILRNEQFKSDSESLDIFENLNLDDNSLNAFYKRKLSASEGVGNLGDAYKRLKDMEELLSVKDTAIASLNAELESVKEQSTPSTMSTSTTDYKPYQEEFHNRLVEFQSAVAQRDNLIEQLTESLQQSLAVRENLRQQSENFAQQILELQRQLEDTSNMVRQHQCQRNVREKQDDETGEQSKDLLDGMEDEPLSLSSLNASSDVKAFVNNYVKRKLGDFKAKYRQELGNLEEKMEKEQQEHENEVAKLKDLLDTIKCNPIDLKEIKDELDQKHAKEMEELRTYFEQKCTDLEKHYSDEILSRKMSGSSSCSDLASELLFSGSQPVPGPAGDSGPASFDLCKLHVTRRDLNTLTRSDLIRLKADLEGVCGELSHYNLDKITKQELNTLKAELAKYDLRELAKFDLCALQNKYHAELEILREDYENRIDLMNVEHENGLRALERKYDEEIEGLRFQLDEAARIAESKTGSAAVQEVGSSGEFEISEVVESYERRLQEQIALAKFDIISGLEAQIQRLAANEDEDWPEELLRLRDRFTERYEARIQDMRSQHEEEVARLKEQQRKHLTGALQRARRRSSSLTDEEVAKERDGLLKTTSVLRHLLNELMKYFARCEDELNGTIIEELLKHGFDRNLSELEDDLSLNGSGLSGKRVHFAPDFGEFLKVLDNSTLDSLESKEISLDLKNELELCLEKLKADANAVLTLTQNFRPDGQRDLNEKLAAAQTHALNIEAEKLEMETQIERLIERQNNLEADLRQARGKIVELIESGRKEIVSEGYGENVSGSNRTLGLRVSTMAELQDKARAVLSESSSSDQSLLRLIEELSHAGDELTEEARKDRDDLVKQVKLKLQQNFGRITPEKVEAADKKYRATCQFLEEQAAEREQERDESQREILSLREQLRDRDRERASCERVHSEEEMAPDGRLCNASIAGTVEQLEHQMREMSKLIEANELKQQETDAERKEAVEKIWVLRDIIRDLESQVESKAETEAELRALVFDLQEVVQQQSQANAELAERLEASDAAEGGGERVAQLEKELQRLRLNAELVGNEGVLKQIGSQLTEFGATLDKRTHDLEGLHSTLSTACSSPSEDMSIRDQVRPRTPASALDECDVPLQQLARLKEKLVRHSRAEDAAMKRIRDLEMQLAGVRHELEDAQNERDSLQDQVTEQLVLISSLQIRLDEQRLFAEDIRKQTNTSLEARIYDLESEIQTLKDTVHSRDKTVKQLNNTLEHTKQRLEELQKEMRAQKDEDVVLELRRQLDEQRSENQRLQKKLDTNAHSAQLLPNLVDGIIADKNADIERLSGKLSETERQLQSFLSLNLSHEQLRSIGRMGMSDRALAEMLSLAGEQARRAESRCATLGSSHEFDFKRGSNETTPIGGLETAEISCIERLGPPNVDYTAEGPLVKPNSTEIQRHVHFEDSDEILKLRNELHMKEQLLNEYSGRIKALGELEAKIEYLQKTLDRTEENLRTVTDAFEKERLELKDVERNLRVELAEKKMHLSERDKKLQVYEQDSVRKDQMYINLAKEKRELEKHLNAMHEERERYKDFEDALAEKNRQIYELEERLADVSEPDPNVRRLEYDLKVANEEIEKLRTRLEELETRHNSETKRLEDALVDKKCEIEILNEDLKHFQDEIDARRSQDSGLERENGELGKRVEQLRELLNEKDKIINQMSEDSKNLHRNLETIQNKIQETGNIIDLARRLRDEQKLNVELQEEIHLLKATLLERDRESPDDVDVTIEEIAGKVRKELDFSAQLDSSILSALEESDHSTASENLRKTNADLQHKLQQSEQQCADLQAQIENLKASSNSLSKTELTEYKSLPDATELAKLRKRLELAENEAAKLRAAKRENEASLKYVSDVLESKSKELETVRGKLSDGERCLEKRAREVDNARVMLDEMEEDRRRLKTRLEEQNRRIAELESKPPPQEMDVPIPEKLSKKIKELSNLVRDNKQMTDTLAKLTDERRLLQERIKELEMQTNVPLPFTDPVARANHLFARYLRADSYRKALVWQKRYLLSLLAEYQDVSPITRTLRLQGCATRVSVGKARFKCIAVAVIATIRMQFLVQRWHSGKRLVVQVNSRHAQRVGVGVVRPPRVQRQTQVSQFHVGLPVSGEHFVYSQQWQTFEGARSEPTVFGDRLNNSGSAFAVNSAAAAGVEFNGSSWSGLTPPSKETRRRNVVEFPAANGGRCLPEILAHYVDRFNEIQSRLELTATTNKK